MSVVNTNIASLNSWRNLTTSQNSMNSSLEKLSSGKKINKAADDASGLAITEKMTAQINGLDQATQNSQNAISMIQTAEGALNETTSILQRMRTLAVAAVNSTQTNADRQQTQKEVDQLFSEIHRIATTTEFNTQKLVDGTASTTSLTFQIGANKGQTMSAKIGNMKASILLAAPQVAMSTGALASAAIATISTALTTVAGNRATLGAIQNRLSHTVNNLEVASENLSAARSNIQDTDMAKEMANYSKQQVLIQSGTAMLAQANQSSQSVLKLLQ